MKKGILFKGYYNNSSHWWSVYFMTGTALQGVFTPNPHNSPANRKLRLIKKGNLPTIIQLQVKELGFHARPSEQKNAPICATRSWSVPDRQWQQCAGGMLRVTRHPGSRATSSAGESDPRTLAHTVYYFLKEYYWFDQWNMMAHVNFFQMLVLINFLNFEWSDSSTLYWK